MAYPPTTSTPTSSAASSRGRIPTPSRSVSSSIPTPGRSRAGSVANASGPVYTPLEDSPGMAKALSEAIRANNPKQHQPAKMSENRSPNSSPTSQPSNTFSFAASGRRSVAKTGPPSTITTNFTSAQSRAVSAPKTPTSSTGRSNYAFTPRASTSSTMSRPESRQSDTRDIRGKPGKDRPFETGDAVRIESLGMEGTLRYLGAIDGKSGMWAGVELAPGFVGRGKNDGTVNGVSYFSCGPKCGVFVAVNKLSAPIPRPSSVASSRGGRTTPALSTNGRVTPAMSNGGRATPAASASGRVTPARSVSTSGRITPSSFATPGSSGARPRQSIATPGLTPGAKPRKSTVPEANFTAGSRASKYLNMTAQELSIAKNAERHSTTTATTTTNGVNGKAPSPPRSALPGSPFATPKAPSTSRPTIMGIPTPGGLKSRPSLTAHGPGTPRSGRKTDMPPPPSPVSPTKRLLAGSPSQGRLGLGLSAASPSRKLVTPTSPSPRRLMTPTGSEFSFGGEDRDEKVDHIADLEARNKELQERIANLMNGKGVSGSEAATSTVLSSPESTNTLSITTSPPPQPPPIVPIVDNTALEEEKARTAAAHSRISELETQVRFHERAVKERESRLDAVGRDLKIKQEEIEKVRAEGETRARELKSKLDDAEALVESLRAAVEEVREGKKEETEAIVGAKDKEIGLLNAKVSRLVSEFEEERTDLASQIEELRKAGQETIALYEEKLDDAETKRWEMEDRLRDLEDKVRKQKRSMSPTSIVQHASEAAKIDNETLREQVTHLERKVNQLETQLECAQDSADKEEQAMRARISKYKDNESLLRHELLDVRSEVESRKRAEATSKARIEEVEEALRENAVALENARAEIENLRTDLANLEGVQTGVAAKNKVDEDGVRSATEKARLEEINQLKELLESARASTLDVTEQYKAAKEEVTATSQQVRDLKRTVEALELEKAELKQTLDNKTAELTAERKANTESDRKSLHREQSIIGGQRDSVLSNNSTRSSREQGEEIAGLKYIVQELNKQNAELTSRLTLLESDKKLLQEETDELREAVRILESNVNDELDQLDQGSSGTAPEDVQKVLRETKAKHEVELGQLRQKLKEAEQKHAQTVNELNKEVNELETLIEAKIYREDELERELERYKDKVERASQRKHSKTNGDPVVDAAGGTSKPITTTSSSHPETKPSIDRTAEGDVCEICEEPGHDIFTCHLLKGDMPSSNTRSSYTLSVTDSESSDLWCDDCETSGHVAADCPHSMEVF